MKNKKVYCDCGKEIDYRAKRCSSCWYKYNTGNNNSNFIGGDRVRECFCMDCKKKLGRLAYYCETKRCKSCENKRRIRLGIINNNDKNCGKYIDGRTKANYYCIDCNKKINRVTFFYGTKRCRSCAGKHSSKKGKDSHLFGKITHGKGDYYKGIWMRSSWEIIYAKYLDKNKIKWLYEPKTFDLGNTTYTPDFYLSKTNTYIEIKGYWRDDAKKKFKLFKKLYLKEEIIILQKENLYKLGVL